MRPPGLAPACSCLHRTRGWGAWIVLPRSTTLAGHRAGRRRGFTFRQRTMKIIKPIIIVGTGRCGSTLFHRLLARHPQVMWMSGFCERYPSRPAWNRRAVTAMDNPLVRRIVGHRVQPGECYRFWDKYAYGFSEPCRDLVRGDVTPRVKKQVRRAFEAMLTPARHRMLIK